MTRRAWVVAVAAVLLLAPAGRVEETLAEADRLAQEVGRLGWGEGKFEAAVPLARRELAIRERLQGPEHPDVARALIRLADMLRESTQLPEAEALCRRSMQIAKAVVGDDHRLYADALFGLAAVLSVQVRHEEALPLRRQVVSIYHRNGGENQIGYALAVHCLADTLRWLDRPAEAEPLYRRAYSIRRGLLGESAGSTIGSLLGIAQVLAATGRRAEALRLVPQLLDGYYKTAGETHPTTLGAMSWVAAVLAEAGRYTEAEALLRRVLAARKRALGEQNAVYSYALSGLAGLTSTQGRHREAEDLYRQAWAIQMQLLGPAHPSTTQTLRYVARECYLEGPERAAAAVAAIRQWHAAEREAHGERALRTGCASGCLGAMLCWSGEYQQGLAVGRANLARAQEGGDRRDYLNALTVLSVMLVESEHRAEAEQLYRQAVQMHFGPAGPPKPSGRLWLGFWVTRHALAGTPERALAYLDEALQAEQREVNLALPALAEPDQIAYMKTCESGFAALLSLARSRPTEAAFVRTALDWTLRRKGLILSTLLQERQALRLSADPATAPTWSALRIAQSQFSKLSLAGPGKEGAEAHRRRLDEVASEIETRRKALAEQSAAVRNQQRTEEADAQKVADALPRGSALVELVTYRVFDYQARGSEGHPYAPWREPAYLAFVLRAGSAAATLVDLGAAKDIDDAVGEFQTAARDPRRRGPTAGQRLRESVWTRLEPHLGGATRVYLAPDGMLNLVSFGALPDGGGGYLAERYTFVTLASGRDLLRRPAPAGQRGLMGIFADPDFGTANAGPARDRLARLTVDDRAALVRMSLPRLPGTRAEGEAIAALARAQGYEVGMRLDRDATEAAIKSLARPRLLHVASHGFFLPDVQAQASAADPRSAAAAVAGQVALTPGNPMQRSGLVLAGAERAMRGEPLPDGDEDGILTAEEAATLDLETTQLVCLSACETGQGVVRRGEGVMGLRRALVLAGTDGLVMSLWSVPDQETREVMVGFYRRYLESGDAPRSLAEAQRAFLAERRAAHRSQAPYYWGAFVVGGGEPRAATP